MRQTIRTRRATLATATVLSLVAVALWTVPLVAQAEARFTPGTALAEASPFGVNLVYNDANVGFSAALSSASFASSTAKASASTFSFGLLTLVAAITFCGEHPLPSGLVPDPLAANSDEGGGGPVEKTSGSDQALSLGATRVRAAAGAEASADTVAIDLDLAGILAVSGGESHVRATSHEPTRTRRASADTHADVFLFDGLIGLTGMSFHLEQTSVGDDAETSERQTSSHVAFGTLTLAGLPVPLPDDPSAAADEMNKIISPLGVQVLPPTLVSEGRFGQRLTPMTIRVGGKSAYSDAVASLAGIPQVIELQQQLQKGLFDTQQCNQLAGLLQPFPEINALYNAVGVAAPILAAVVVNALAGGGSVDVQVGGVRTGIDDTRYLPPTFSRPARPAGEPTPQSTINGSGPALGIAPGSTGPTGVAPTAPVGVVSTRCATTSPAARPGCWSGLAPLGAAAVFLLSSGLLATDELRRRRLATLEPMETP